MRFEVSEAGLTAPARVVYIPTRDNYAVLLSVDRPTEFLQALRRLAAGIRRP